MLKQVEKAITNKTKAIISVHLYSHPADMDLMFEIARKYGLICRGCGTGPWSRI